MYFFAYEIRYFMVFVCSINGMGQNRGSENLMTDTLTFLCHGILLRILCIFNKSLHLFDTREHTISQLYCRKSSHEDRIRVLKKPIDER